MSHHHHHHQMRGRTLLFSVVINSLITVAQFIGGLMSGSMALLSDALHNFSDVISLLVSYIANRLMFKKADFSKTFGYKRAEIIAAFINAATLIVVAVILIKESIVRFFEPPQSIEAGLVIWLALIAIVGNGFCALLMKSDSAHNLNMRSSYLHLLTDMFTSVAVLIGGLLMKFYQVYWVDSVLTILIGAYLIYTGLLLLKSTVKVLMLFSPDDIIIEELVERFVSLPEVNNIHHVHIWLLNEDEIHLEAHIDFKENIQLSEFNLILKKIETIASKEFGINHSNIQPEFDRCDNKAVIVQD